MVGRDGDIEVVYDRSRSSSGSSSRSSSTSSRRSPSRPRGARPTQPEQHVSFLSRPSDNVQPSRPDGYTAVGAANPAADDLAGLQSEMEAFEIIDPPDEASRSSVRKIFSDSLSSISRRMRRFRVGIPTVTLPTLPAMPSLPPMPTMPTLPPLPEQFRPRWFVVARLAGLATIIVLIWVLFSLDGGVTPATGPFSPEAVRAFVEGGVDGARMRQIVTRMAAFGHVAGTEGDLYVRRWVEAAFRATGMDHLEVTEYATHVNYPTETELSIVAPNRLVWTARHDEPGAGSTQAQMAIFHGLAKAGDVTGPAVYANYGSLADFDYLRKHDLDLAGAVALIRIRPDTHSAGAVVKQAELAGCAAAVLFVDPSDQPAGTWPDGKSVPGDAVFRTSVGLTNWVLGDVLTPGWPSGGRSHRLDKNEATGLVRIPSMPVSLDGAFRILDGISGGGRRVPESWYGSIKPELWTGSTDRKSDKTVMVRVRTGQDEPSDQRIWNVVGHFRGAETAAHKIVIGAPRDEWCFGAASTGSGTAVLLELVAVFEQLHAQGWRPRRTVEFASWDGSGYNLVGSTEHVEERRRRIAGRTAAYINLGRGVTGDEFSAVGSPSLSPVLSRVLGRVVDPTGNGTTLRQRTGGKVGQPTVDGDYAPFLYSAGVPILDLGFGNSAYPRHSCYDQATVAAAADRGMARHRALAQVSALVVLELAQEPIVPIDILAGTAKMADEVRILTETSNMIGGTNRQLDTTSLTESISKLAETAGKLTKWEHQWRASVSTRSGFESGSDLDSRTAHNDRLIRFERSLLDDIDSTQDSNRIGSTNPGDSKPDPVRGLPGRSQFLHTIVGPPLLPHSLTDNSPPDERLVKSAYFPIVRHHLLNQNWDEAKSAVDRVSELIRKATDHLSVSI